MVVHALMWRCVTVGALQTEDLLRVLCCPLITGFGMTENAAFGGAIAAPNRPVLAHVLLASSWCT